jgi:hypothetical protein
MQKYSFVLAACALVVACVAMALAIVLAWGFTDQSVAAQDSWQGPPGVYVGAELAYLRIDGKEFRVGANVSSIGVVGSNGGQTSRWVKLKITYPDDTSEEEWIYLDNIQLITAKRGDAPAKKDKPASNGDG